MAAAPSEYNILISAYPLELQTKVQTGVNPVTPHLRRLNSDPVSREAAANITADLGECGAFSDCNSCTYEYDYTWASGSKEPLVSAAALLQVVIFIVL